MNYQKSQSSEQHAVIDTKTRRRTAEQLSKKTHFTKHEIENLLKNFQERATGSISGQPVMDKLAFQDVMRMFGITDDIIMDRVFKAFDVDNDTFINMEEWVKGLSVFLRGTLSERSKFCFYMYDLGGDGYIGRDDMFHLLKNCIVKNIADEDQEEPVRELIEYCLKLLDLDHDQRISPSDFCEAVQNDSMLLELLGTCLPSPQKCSEYEMSSISS